MKISELKARQGNVEITADVADVSGARTFEKFGKQGKVANATIRDDSGEVTLSLWNEQADQVQAGDRVHITNGYVNEWQGKLQLTTGKFGKLEVEKGAAKSSPIKPDGNAQAKAGTGGKDNYGNTAGGNLADDSEEGTGGDSEDESFEEDEIG